MPSDVEVYNSAPLKPRRRTREAPARKDRTDEVLNSIEVLLKTQQESSQRLHSALETMLNDMQAELLKGESKQEIKQDTFSADKILQGMTMLAQQMELSNRTMVAVMTELIKQIDSISLEIPEQPPALVDLKVTRDENGDLTGVTGTRT